MYYFTKIGLCALFLLFHGISFASEKYVISGHVLDCRERPIIAATIIVMRGDSLLTGVFSEPDGSFDLGINEETISGLCLKLSSVGYSPRTIWLDSAADFPQMAIHLDEKPIEVGHIKVRPRPEPDNSLLTLGENQVELMARRSLVPSNPIAAVRQPQAIRQGSGHSSKIRLNGTNPDYYLNGINIGHDPNHYGMFSILPASVVEAVSFMPQGTEARFRLPSVFALTTKSPYGAGHKASATMSTIEATGTYSFGNNDFYILGSLRKSVLDKLIENFELESDKMTIPPTNFQDVYASTGLKLTPDLELTVDSYQIRDYLSLKTDATGHNSSGIKSAQNTHESYLGSRLKFISGRTLMTAQLAAKMGREEYLAVAAKPSAAGNFNVNLKASGTEYTGSLDISHIRDFIEINGGLAYSTIPKLTVSLDQVNWNFLPPDANSDKPFVYQNELNQAFGSTDLCDSEKKTALYTTGKIRFGKLKAELGLRAEQFGALYSGRIIAVRHRLMYDVSDKTRLEVFAGSFYESPSSRILDPYQVLIRYNLPNLKPVKTNLYSLTFGHGPWRLGTFYKAISGFPVIDPDFDAISGGVVTKEFFRMTSSGQLSFYGGNIEVNLVDIPTARTDIYASYGYTRATNTYETVTIPYELNAEHKFYAQFDYSLTSKLNLGSDIILRSGFPYTPFKTNNNQGTSGRYTKAYYRSNIETENSETFPTYFSLGMYCEYRPGRLEIHLGISNITDHDNPIVNTSDGYIYDAGIMPVIGMKYTF